MLAPLVHFSFVCFFLGGGGGGNLLTFPTYRVCAYSRWALIRGWALNRINTVLRTSLERHAYLTHKIIGCF